MTEEMSDDHFLDYCTTHAETPRCGFTPAQLARLFRLCGYTASAHMWELEQPSVINCSRDAIMRLVREARREIGEKDERS